MLKYQDIKAKGNLMPRKLFCLLAVFIFSVSVLWADNSVLGLWKTVDDKTGEVKSIVKVYEYRGKVFGRILVTYEDGRLKDTYDDPDYRAEEVKGQPFFAGLDIIWNMVRKGDKWKKGKIMDPKEGKVYSSEMWRDGNDLVVRGKIGPFGRNQTWLSASAADLPSGVQEPSSLTPVIPDY